LSPLVDRKSIPHKTMAADQRPVGLLRPLLCAIMRPNGRIGI
jgi:hypothetical protein